jgi:hypothetical protein
MAEESLYVGSKVGIEPLGRVTELMVAAAIWRGFLSETMTIFSGSVRFNLNRLISDTGHRMYMF